MPGSQTKQRPAVCCFQQNLHGDCFHLVMVSTTGTNQDTIQITVQRYEGGFTPSRYFQKYPNVEYCPNHSETLILRYFAIKRRGFQIPHSAYREIKNGKKKNGWPEMRGRSSNSSNDPDCYCEIGDEKSSFFKLAIQKVV